MSYKTSTSGLIAVVVERDLEEAPENTADYDKVLAIARAIASSPPTEIQRQAAERLAGV